MKTRPLLTRAALLATLVALLLSHVTLANEADLWGVFLDGKSYFQKVTVEDEHRANLALVPQFFLGSKSWTGSVMPSWKSDGAISRAALGVSNSENDSHTLKQKLYDLLKKSNTGANPNSTSTDSRAYAWDEMGSAVVVYTLLGKDWGTGSRTVSEDDWKDLQKRFVDND